MTEPFRFDLAGRGAIFAAFARDVLSADRKDYVTRAEQVVGTYLNHYRGRERARMASKELHKAVARMRSAAAFMISVFEAHPVLNRTPTLRIMAEGVQQDFSREALARLSGGQFERPPQEGPHRQVLRRVLVTNLRHAYLMAGEQRRREALKGGAALADLTAPSEQGCWKVVRATIKTYARQRTQDMPRIPALSDHAIRQALDVLPFLDAR